MALGAAPGGLPPVGAQAVLLGMQQFNQSVRQVSTGLSQINGASVALERNSLLATTRMTSAFGSLSSAYLVGGARMTSTLGLLNAGIAGIGVAAVAAGVGATTAAASFQRAMTPVQVFGDLTDEQTKKISAGVLEMSRTWGVASGEIAKGEAALTKAGASFDDLNGPLAQAVTLLNVASEGELSMAESADIVTQGLRSWKIPTSEAVNFVNALVGATNASTAGFRGMVQGLGQSQAMAANAGVSYRDLFAVLGELNDENIRGERAGTAYRNLLLRMLNPSKEVAGVMVRYGVSLQDTNGQLVSARTFVERLSNAFSDQATAARGLSKAQVESDLATLGMSRSLLGAVAIANQGTAAFDKYQRAIDKTDVVKIAQTFNANTVKQAGIMATNIGAVATVFGGPFNESLTTALTNVNAWLKSLSLEKIHAIAVTIHDDLGGALSYVAGLMRSGVSSIGTVFGNATGGSTAESAVLGIVNSVIVRMQQARDLWNSIWTNTNVSAGATAILSSLAKLADAVLPRVQLALATVGEILTYLIPRAIAAIPWDSIVTTVETAVNETISFLDGGYKQVATDIYNTVVGIVNSVLDVVNQTITAMGTMANDVVAAIIGVATNIMTAVIGAISGVVEGVTGFLDPLAKSMQSVADFAIGIAQRIVAAIGRAFEPLATLMSSDLPSAFGPTFEAFKTILAVLIVAERAWLLFNKAVIDAVVATFANGIPAATNVSRRIFTDFINFQAGVVRALTTSFELAAEGVRLFIEGWRIQLKLGAQLVSEFVEFTVNAFTTVFKWLEQQPFVGQFFKDLHAKFDEIKLSIDGLFQGAADAPVDAFSKIKDAINGALSSVDTTITDVRKSVDDIVGSIGASISGLGSGMQQAFDEAKGVVASILPTLTNAGEGVRKFLETMIDSARARINSATPEAQKFLDTIKGILAGISAIPTTGLPTAGGAAHTLPGAAPETGAEPGFPVDQAKQMQDYVASLLRDIPAITEEFTQFIAKLAEADPSRLASMVNALESQRGVLASIGQLRLQILQTDIQIAQVDAKLADEQRQQQILQLQMQQVSLPYEQKLLELRRQSLVVEGQMAPIQAHIADIDKQISLLQREDLDLKARELAIRTQMMPIENQIADIDKAIADTQKENYGLSIAAAQVQLQMLPIQNQIADIEKQIAANNEENYALTRQRLLIEQQEVPVRNAIADIDKQIQAAQQTNYTLVGEQLALQQQMLPYQQQIADLQQQMNDATRTNYTINRQLAELDQQALPYKQNIAAIEQQISDIINKREQLGRDRASLIAQHDLTSTENSIKSVGNQLDALWAKFNGSTGADRSALIPQILDLEKQKKDLTDALKPAQDLVDTLKQQQDEIDYNNKLTEIGLQMQEADQEALLAPITAQINALKDQQAVEQALADTTKARLEEAQAAVQALLDPLQRQLDLLKEQQDREQLIVDIVVNGLNAQKQGLEIVLQRYEDEIDAIKRTEDAQKLAAEIANTLLQEQEQKLKKVLDAYDAELTMIQRLQAAENLRNEIIRLGLEQQKQKLEDILRSWQDQLDIVQREQAAEELRNSVLITALEKEKRQYEDQLLALQNQKDAIDRQTAAITNQQQLATIAYQAQILSLQTMENENSLYKLQLEGVREQEQARLAALISQFEAALTKSGAFTTTEIGESTKRLGLWQGEVDKLADLNLQYTVLQTALGVTTPYATAKTSNDNLTTALNNVVTAVKGVGTSVDTYGGKLSGGSGALNTYIDNAKTSALNLATALNGSGSGVQSIVAGMTAIGADTNHGLTGSGSLAGNLDSVTSSAKALATAIGTDTTTSGAVTQALNELGVQIDIRRYSLFGTNTSIAYAADKAHDSFSNLAAAINDAANALVKYSGAVARDIATQATANAYAAVSYQQDRAAGLAPGAALHDVYTSILSYISSGAFGFAEGGFVPGPMGAPQLATVHGGEYVVSRGEQRQLTAAITRAITTYNSTNTTITYNFSANYERQQDPITADMDMRTVIAMTR